MLSAAPHLLVVVEVPRADRILCQSPGCNHPVFRRIHVVRLGDSTTVLGSECFKKLYGTAPSIGNPQYGSAEGRKLTEAERALLRDNIARLIEQFEAEHQHALATAPAIRVRAPDASVPGHGVSDEAILVAEAQVKRELRSEGLDPDLPGYRGLVDTGVERMLKLPTLTLHRLRNKKRRALAHMPQSTVPSTYTPCAIDALLQSENATAQTKFLMDPPVAES